MRIFFIDYTNLNPPFNSISQLIYKNKKTSILYDSLRYIVLTQFIIYQRYEEKKKLRDRWKGREIIYFLEKIRTMKNPVEKRLENDRPS